MCRYGGACISYLFRRWYRQLAGDFFSHQSRRVVHMFVCLDSVESQRRRNDVSAGRWQTLNKTKRGK